MKTRCSVVLLLCTSFSFAQNPTAAAQLVNAGVAEHDKGNYAAALAQYEQALAIDTDNLQALTEKGYTYLAQQNFEACITVCELAIKKHKGEEGLKTTYVLLGNAYDQSGKPDQAIGVYKEGIKIFPAATMLYFNQGITEAGQKDYEAALKSLQLAVKANPKHASSYNAMARILEQNNNRVPAVLAYCRFLVLETQTARANQNFTRLNNLLVKGVEQKDANNITVNIASATLEEKKGKDRQYDFNSTDMILSLSASMDYSDENKDKTALEKFQSKMTTVCSSLSDSEKNKKGFYWNTLAPYFADMNRKKMLEVFSNLAFAAGGDKTAIAWLASHTDEKQRFLDWSDSFAWNFKDAGK